MFIDDHAMAELRAAAKVVGTDSAHVLEVARHRRARGFAAWIASLFAAHSKGEDNGYGQATARVGRYDPELARRN
jgi:hypothetical protein